MRKEQIEIEIVEIERLMTRLLGLVKDCRITENEHDALKSYPFRRKLELQNELDVLENERAKRI